jgi:hypothetical protein
MHLFSLIEIQESSSLQSVTDTIHGTMISTSLQTKPAPLSRKHLTNLPIPTHLFYYSVFPLDLFVHPSNFRSLHFYVQSHYLS